MSSMEADLPKLNANDKEVKNKEVPFLAVIEKEKIVEVKVPSQEFDFIQEVKDFKPDFYVDIEHEMPVTKIKNNIVQWTYDKVARALSRVAVKEEEKIERQKEFPRLIIEDNDVNLNGMSLKERIAREFPDKSVKSDLENLCKYMDSFLNFRQYGEDSRDIVWKLLCYSFTSPYMTRLRRLAEKNRYSIHCFPMFGIIYGEASTTKTSMTKIIRSLMCGTVGEGFSFYPSCDFTQTDLLQKIKAMQVGLPIFIQDLTKEQWDNHAGKILKNDRYETKNKFDSPITIITSNDIKTLKKEFSKRCLCFNPKTIVTTKDLVFGSKKFNEFCNSFSPSLFLEYVQRMNIKVKEMEKRLNESDDEYLPDIVKISSITLREICQDILGHVPEYMYEIDFVRDLYAEETVGKTKIHELQQYWLSSPELFSFRKDGRVFVNMMEVYLASRAKQELPTNICLEQSGRTLICSKEELAKIGIKERTLINKLKGLLK